MNKCHTPITWLNDQTPAINDTHLNQYDGELDTLDDRIITLDGTKALQSDLLLAFKDVSLDATTGIITFTLFNNTTKTIDTLLEKIAINFDYDDDPTSPHYQNLIIELEDGTYKYIDMSALITEYEFDTSSTIAFTVANDGTVTADVIDGSITSSKLDPALATPIVNAESNGLKSEGFAVGEQNGVPVSSGSPYYQNNAKYYKEQAAAIAQQSLGGLSDVTITSAQDGQALIYDANSGEWENSNLPTPTTSLSALTDTTITTPTDKQILTYDNANSKWINADAPVISSNSNLIINGWFNVNQRGWSSGNPSTGAFVADRWKIIDNKYSAMSVSLSNSGLTIQNGGVVRQYFEENPAPGKTVTLSVLFQDGTVLSASGNCPSTTPTADADYVSVKNSNNTWFKFGFRSSMFMVHMDCTSVDTVAVRAIKLEVGSTSTIHLDAAPDYTTELLKCQRYYYKISCTSDWQMFGIGYVESATVARFFIFFPVNMRIPLGASATFSYSGSFYVRDGSVYPVSTNVQISNSTRAGAHIRVDVSSGLTQGHSCMLSSYDANSALEFKAEL